MILLYAENKDSYWTTIPKGVTVLKNILFDLPVVKSFNSVLISLLVKRLILSLSQIFKIISFISVSITAAAFKYLIHLLWASELFLVNSLITDEFAFSFDLC